MSIQPILNLAAGVILLSVRGILLWVVIPVATLLWAPIQLTYWDKRITVGQVIAWADINFIALIQHTILRPLNTKPLAWIPARELPNIKHRVKIIDLY